MQRGIDEVRVSMTESDDTIRGAVMGGSFLECNLVHHKRMSPMRDDGALRRCEDEGLYVGVKLLSCNGADCQRNRRKGVVGFQCLQRGQA